MSILVLLESFSSDRKLTNRCTGTPQFGRLSCKRYLRPVSLVVSCLEFRVVAVEGFQFVAEVEGLDVGE